VLGITKVTIAMSTAIKMITPMTPTIIKWLNLPWLKSLSLFLLLCTPKNAAATLLTVLRNDEFLLGIFILPMSYKSVETIMQ
jgi:hypothetical protein